MQSMRLWRGSVLPMSRPRRPRRNYGALCAPREPARRTRVERHLTGWPIDHDQRHRRQSIAASVGAHAGPAGTAGSARSIGIATLQSFGSARFLAGKQLADRAEKFRLWAPPFRHSLGVEASPQAEPRRLRRMATPAVLAAAHSSAALLHRSSLTQPAGPDDPEVDPTCGTPKRYAPAKAGQPTGRP